MLIATATGRIGCRHESRHALTTASIRRKAAATSQWVAWMILNGRPLLGIHLPAARWLLPPPPAIHAYAEAPTRVVETPAYVIPAHRASQCMLGPNRTLTSCPTTSYWVGRDAMHQRATHLQRMLESRDSVQILLGVFCWRGWVC